MSKRKFLIDCDAGVDDAHAILMALGHDDVDVIAITTCHGNVPVQQVCINVCRVLQVANRLDIPVFPGCETSLLGSNGDSTCYHGKDGLGNVPDPVPPDVSSVRTKHAVLKITEVVNEYPGEITMVCLAPLTNIAMATRLDPMFSSKLKQCYIMGGNYEGKGNITNSAEYNFHTDPEAADIVMREMKCPVTLACWELCIKYAFRWEFYWKLRSPTTKISQFLQKIETYTRENCPFPSFVCCDELAMAMAIQPEVIKEKFSYSAGVELHGVHTRGQVVIYRNSGGKHNQTNLITFVTELHTKIYEDLLFAITS